MTSQRDAVLAALADRILATERPHPVRVAIDGPDAAGKTTLADELAGRLRAAGRPVIRASADDFGRPRAERYRRGRDAADGYRLDAFDHDALARLLLEPLGPAGDRRYRATAFDLDRDTPRLAGAQIADPDAVLLVDGVFLLAPRLRDHWDVRVFVRVAAETTLARALQRDVPTLGDRASVEARYRARYLPAQADYLALDRPLEAAGIVIDNDDPAAPRLVERTAAP